MAPYFCPSSLFCPSLWPICPYQTLPPLPRSSPPPVTSTPFVRIYWAAVGEAGRLRSAVSSIRVCVCVCLSGQCGNVCVRKSCRQSSVQTQRVRAHTTTRSVCRSCSSKCSHKLFVLVYILKKICVSLLYFPHFTVALTTDPRDLISALFQREHLELGSLLHAETMQPPSGSHSHENCVQMQHCGEFHVSLVGFYSIQLWFHFSFTLCFFFTSCEIFSSSPEPNWNKNCHSHIIRQILHYFWKVIDSTIFWWFCSAAWKCPT